MLENIGSRLRAVRVENGLTLVELAKQVGCTHGYLSQIENGQKAPSRPFLTALASALLLRDTWLLTGEVDRDRCDRVRQVREALSLTIEQLAARIDVPPEELARVEACERDSTIRLWQPLSSRLGVNDRWLTHGEGPMFLPPEFRVDQVIGPEQKHLVAPDDPKLASLVWNIAEWWARARAEERAWFELQFKREFPEVADAGGKTSGRRGKS